MRYNEHNMLQISKFDKILCAESGSAPPNKIAHELDHMTVYQ